MANASSAPITRLPSQVLQIKATGASPFNSTVNGEVHELRSIIQDTFGR